MASGDDAQGEDNGPRRTVDTPFDRDQRRADDYHACDDDDGHE